MVAAIGSTVLPSHGAALSPTAGLEAQIVRYQKQLSDCVNCDSANTAAGKATIQEISDKISGARARIEEINVAKSLSQPSISEKQPDTSANKVATATTVNDKASVGSERVPKLTNDTVGSLINVLA